MVILNIQKVPASKDRSSPVIAEFDAALAGFESGDINSMASPCELIVKTSHESGSKKKEKRKGVGIQWSEFKSEDVYRHVELPEAVDADHISAHLDNGLLKIMTPKVQEKNETSKQNRISATA